MKLNIMLFTASVLIIWFILYLLFCFIEWDILNPVAHFYEFSEWSKKDRVGYAFGMFICACLSCLSVIFLKMSIENSSRKDPYSVKSQSQEEAIDFMRKQNNEDNLDMASAVGGVEVVKVVLED